MHGYCVPIDSARVCQSGAAFTKAFCVLPVTPSSAARRCNLIGHALFVVFVCVCLCEHCVYVCVSKTLDLGMTTGFVTNTEHCAVIELFR